jgi:hypothetical protein
LTTFTKRGHEPILRCSLQWHVYGETETLERHPVTSITITDGESTWSATLPSRILAELHRLATATITPAHIAATLLDVAVAQMQANSDDSQITSSA